MTPKLSIVVPIYNVEPYLARCVESLLEQTIKDIEIILVDDESPDNCPLLCDEYARKYQNIKVIHKKNAGLGMACNSGIELASGEYIAFCDSDDYVAPTMYHDLYEAAMKNDADAVYSGIKTVNEKGEVKHMNEPVSCSVMKDKVSIHKFLLDMIANTPSIKEERLNAMSAKIVLYRKGLIDKFNLRFVSERVLICEDLIWNMDILCHASCIMTIPKSYYYYYNNSSSLSKKIRFDRFHFFKTLRVELLLRAYEYDMPEETRIRIDRMFIGYCRFYIGQIVCSSFAKTKKKELVTKMCTDSIWKEIWQNYPIRKMPIVHRIAAIFMKHNCFSGLNLIYSVYKR